MRRRHFQENRHKDLEWEMENMRNSMTAIALDEHLGLEGLSNQNISDFLASACCLMVNHQVVQYAAFGPPLAPIVRRRSLTFPAGAHPVSRQNFPPMSVATWASLPNEPCSCPGGFRIAAAHWRSSVAKHRSSLISPFEVPVPNLFLCLDRLFHFF
jgi:hypothetical protein